MMNKYYLNLIADEVKNFNDLQKKWKYENLDELIGHYIEEDIISSKKELEKVLKTIEVKLGIRIKAQIFHDGWQSYL